MKSFPSFTSIRFYIKLLKKFPVVLSIICKKKYLKICCKLDAIVFFYDPYDEGENWGQQIYAIIAPTKVVRFKNVCKLNWKSVSKAIQPKSIGEKEK